MVPARGTGNRDTRWPGPEDDGVRELTISVNEGDKRKPTVNSRVFPGKTDSLLDLKSLRSLAIPRTDRQAKDSSAKIPPRISLKVNASDSNLTRETRGSKKRPPLNHWLENPWGTYRQLRPLERGGMVMAACTRKAPFEMVTIKELRAALHNNELEWFYHCNLVALLESYQFEQKQLAVTEYTVATLKQIMAAPLALEEIHVSAVCCQVFEGIRHLSRFGIIHSNLNTSKILFTADGCVKIDDYQALTSNHARPLGVIAIEMMQNGIPPDPGHQLVLRHPDQWSPEAANFLAVASWGSLEDLDNNKFLTCLSPTIMIAYVESARWNTVEWVT